MSNLCIVGLQWGDEGKGKVVDMLAGDFDIVARYQGGSNAGHTVIIGDEKYVLHLVPSGIIRGKDCVVGNGVAVDPILLLGELDDLQSRGITIGDNLKISDRAHMVMPYHKVLDGLDGSTSGKGPHIGTTKKGIGPCYADKMARLGIRVGELLDPERFEAHLRQNCEIKNKLLKSIYGLDPVDVEGIRDEYLAAAERLKPYICDVTGFMKDALDRKRSILFEGAQGVLLDIDFGTFPYVTCSHPGAGGIASGLGVPPRSVDRVLGIMKAYVTRVGEGPFPTQAQDAVDQRLRDKGGEYGATTGRPRRCGWFDAVAARYACFLNGVDTIALMKLDVLGGEDEIKVCTGYKLNGAATKAVPADARDVAIAEPQYESLPGWAEDISGVTAFDDLPANARDYIAALEEMVGVTIGVVSVGPEREQIILRGEGPLS